MKIVVTGASGNVGSAVVERLAEESGIDSIVGVCRRPHDWRPDKTTWAWADVSQDDLAAVFEGADAVVHLAWLFQPTRAPGVTWAANVVGTKRVLDAVVAAGVPAVVVASSVGAYSPRTSTDPVDESWPTDGAPTAAYSREKAYVERLLDVHEREHPDCRVVRLRPVFIFSERASIEQRRLFLGPFVPHAVLAPGRVPLLPLPRELVLQALHARDVADAFARAATGPARGAYNLAPTDVLTPPDLARLLRGRWLPTPARALRAAMGTAFRLRAIPAAPELFDLVMAIPVLDAGRAKRELGWSPRASSAGAVEAFLRGVHADDPVPTPPLVHSTSGPVRSHELSTGVGRRP